jgi:shikimate dehydrogenase
MGKPYAELIGDPIGHSRSPAIHGFWLETLGLEGEYRAARVKAGGLRAHLEKRRSDPWWRGCNLTAPLKREAASLVGDPIGVCGWLGAVNCLFRSPLHGLVPANTDVSGLEAALADVPVEGADICLVGAGGAAMAALCWLAGRKARKVTILVRDPNRAARIAPADAGPHVAIEKIERAAASASGARLLINATPMGMTGGQAMRPELFEALAALPPEATAFDMVYAPAETALLRAARDRGLRAIDGLEMLIGQAAPAFELFFGAPPPRGRDSELRERLRS